MKKLLGSIVSVLLAASAFGDAASDLILQQRNSINTGFDKRLVSPVASGVFTFNSSKQPESLALTALIDRLGSTRGAVLYRGASGWTILAPGTSGYYLTAQGAGADPIYTAPPSGTTAANPSASIGLTAINGSSGDYMRADAAPALSQSIAPTWTGAHYFNNSTTSTSSSTGAVKVTGGVGIGENLNVGGTFGLTGNATLGGTAAITGNTTIGGTLGVTGALTAGSITGYAIGTDVQAYDADLAAIAALSTTGLVERTGSGTAAIRAMGVGASTSVPTRADGDTRWLQLAGGTLTGTLTLNGDPATDLEAATKQYVDAISGGIQPRDSVDVATTANVSLTGEQTIDGVLTSTSRVAVWKQTAAEENGIYNTAAGGWSRASDANTAGELAKGYSYLVEGGTQAGTVLAISTEPTSLGSDPVAFSVFSNLSGALAKASNLSDVSSASTARTNLGLGTSSAPQFANLGIGAAATSQVGINISGTHSGSTTSYGILDQGTIQSGVTNSFHTFNSAPSTAAASFSLGALRHFVAGEGALGAGSSITTQVGFYVSPLVNGGTNIAFSGNVASGTNRWNAYMAGTAPNYFAGSTGIGTAPTSNSRLVIGGNYTGATTLFGVYHSGSIQSDVTTSFGTYTSQPSTAAASFTLPDLVHFSAAQGTIGAGSTITRQYGFVANSSLTGATNNYGFYGNIASGTNRWNAYMVGTAANLFAGITSFTNTAASTSTSTGAVVVTGGLGVGKMVTAAGFAETNVVNVVAYGADPTGVSDSTTAFADAIAAAAPDGKVTAILLNDYVGGYSASPANDWTGRPSITLTGALSGASGFQAYGNVNTDGYLSAIEISNQGSGYNVLTYTVNRTSGSPVVTLSSGTFDARIVAGVSVRFESLSTSCTVVSRDSSTQLTLSENMTFTNSDQFVFGFPVVQVDGVSNTDNFVPILGTAKTLKIPAGSYKLPTGIGNIGGKSNLTIDAEGAEFIITSTTGAVGVTIRNSSGITWNGGEFKFLGARYQVPNAAFRSTRYPGQSGFKVDSSQFVHVNRVKTWDPFMFGFAISGDATAGRYWAEKVFFNGVEAINSLGDGIHFTTGSRRSRVNGASIVSPGDDALAVVNDSDVAARSPADIVFENCVVDGGIYRGCVALGADGIVFRNIRGKNTHGPFLWAQADGSFDAPSNVTFQDIIADDLGNTSHTLSDTNSGIGISASSMTGLTLRGLKFSQHSSVAGANPVINVDAATITGLDWDEQQINSTSGSGTYGGSLNSDLDCQAANGFASVTLGVGRWFVTGNITARSSTGSGVTIWPVFFDGTSEYGGGSAWQTSDLTHRASLAASAFVNVASGTKTIRFKLKQGGGGVTIDAGSASGPNSIINAQRL